MSDSSSPLYARTRPEMAEAWRKFGEVIMSRSSWISEEILRHSPLPERLRKKLERELRVDEALKAGWGKP